MLSRDSAHEAFDALLLEVALLEEHALVGGAVVEGDGEEAPVVTVRQIDALLLAAEKVIRREVVHVDDVLARCFAGVSGVHAVVGVTRTCH